MTSDKATPTMSLEKSNAQRNAQGPGTSPPAPAVILRDGQIFERRVFNVASFVLDFCLLSFSFMVVTHFKRGDTSMTDSPPVLLAVAIFSWIASGLLGGKFRPTDNPTTNTRIEVYLSSAVIFGGLLVSTIYLFDFYYLSRFVVFGTLGLYVLFEMVVLSGAFFPAPGTPAKRRLQTPALLFLVTEVIGIPIVFVTLQSLRAYSPEIEARYQVVLSLVVFSWVMTAIVVHKYKVPDGASPILTVAPFIKAQFIALAVLSFIVFGFRFSFSRLVVFGTVSIMATFQLIVVGLSRTLSGFGRIPTEFESEHEPRESAIAYANVVQEVVDREQAKGQRVEVDKRRFKSGLTRIKFRDTYLKARPDMFDLLERTVELDSVDILNAECLDTGSVFNLEILREESLELLVNLAPMNRYKGPSQMLAAANQVLRQGGVYVGCFEPCERRWLQFSRSYPVGIDSILYLVDFIWNRVMPKFPVLRHLWSFMSKGAPSVLSTAEALGRLFFCGFNVSALGTCGSSVVFLVTKVRTGQDQDDASSGLFFRQRRVGLGGKPIHVFKMRTMHPFSEYIHSYVIETNRLDERGKVANDFRVTRWGRWLRRIWIDELPMLVNLMRGDLKLIGVRPLSFTFFETYPERLRKKRVLYKPGLIPPFYVHLPNSIDEVWASEEKYLEEYSRRPFWTDVRYFLLAFRNIVFKGAKSS